LCFAEDRLAFTCTIGGPARRGQVFTYLPGPREGTADEADQPGQLELIAEAGEASLLTNADNLTMAPWGDLIVCEDALDGSSNSVIGIRPDGSQYLVADNAYTGSELAGVCFSPDGSIMFLNIQYPGMTVAISGDWTSVNRGQ
jgi:secreted PhoX family phosphatase